MLTVVPRSLITPNQEEAPMEITYHVTVT